MLDRVRTYFETAGEVYGIPGLTIGSLKQEASCLHPDSEMSLL